MKKITNNDNWNVYWKHCGMTSKLYAVMKDDEIGINGCENADIKFINDEDMAIKVCNALNKCKV